MQNQCNRLILCCVYILYLQLIYDQFRVDLQGMQLTGDSEKRTCTVKKISEDMEKPCLSG